MKRRIFWRMVLALVTVSVGLAGPVAAQDTESTELNSDIQILRITQDEDAGTLELLVALPASIGEVDPTQANFGVIEAGLRRSFTVTQVSEGVDVVIVVDTSGSMQGAPLAAARQAAASFIAGLPEDARTAVVGFGATPQVLTTFNDSRESSISAVNSLRARGETALWDALALVSDTIAVDSTNDPYVVLLSDGGDTASSATQSQANSALLESGAALYAITLETPESDHSALRSTGAAVGGTILATEDLSALNQLYDEVGDRLSHRYEIVINSDRTDDRTLRVSVAINGVIATASADIGAGDATPEASPETQVPSSLAGAEEAEEATSLRQFTAASPGGLSGTALLLLGGTALFIGLLALAILVIDPMGARVQSLGSMRAPEATERVTGAAQRMTATADRMIANRDEEKGLDRALDAAGINMRPGEFAVLSLVIAVTAGVLAMLLFNTLAGLLAIGIAATAAYGYVTTKISRRRKAFDSQLHGTISILVGAMRSGRGLPQALELVSQESSSPTAEEFRRVTLETRVGRDPVASLNAVADRMDNKDLSWISQAIQINRELGGDLTELLENLAMVIRDRAKLRLQVRALSAEGRASGWVIGVLPIVMYIYMQFVNREYISLLHQTNDGRMALLVGILAMIGGIVWMKKLVNIRY